MNPLRKNSLTYLEENTMNPVKNTITPLKEFSKAEPRLRLNYEPVDEKICSAADAVDFVGKYLTQLPVEALVAIYLDSQMRPRFYTILSKGTDSQTIASVNDLITPALLSGLTRIIIMHNHPGGELAPSSYDLDFSLKAFEYCKDFGITLYDSIIVHGCRPVDDVLYYPIMSDESPDSPWVSYKKKHSGF